MRTLIIHTTQVSEMTTAEATTTAKATFTPPSTAFQKSPWHSPVPYLFGGLAAMLGLIAFALLILACSYWKLSGQINGEDDSTADVEGGAAEKRENSSDQKSVHVFEEKFLVIMAGDVKPTFLATPMATTKSAASFNEEKVIESNENGKKENQRIEEEEEEEESHVSQHQSLQ